MDFYSLIITNKELMKILYAFVIVFICGIIVFESDRLFRLSLHKGIRYFRNAFLFYGIGFAFRYFFTNHLFSDYFVLTNFLSEFFIIMAGFFLLYSLLWKKIESFKENYASSLFNLKIIIFYLMAFVLTILDYVWQTYYFMFFSQILLFALTSLISYNNYLKKGKNRKFLKFYFIAMFSGFVAWILNTLLALYFDWNKSILMSIYFLNIIIFLLFLYGVVNIIKTKN